MANTDVDRSLLLGRLPGLEAAREKLEEEILNIRSVLWPESHSNARGAQPSAGVKGGGATKKRTSKKVGLSEAGRKRLSDLMKARWAAKRGGAKKRTAKKGRLSEAGRKRLSDLMKARWAARGGATKKRMARKRTRAS